MKAENESQTVDEHDRSKKLVVLNVEDWPLENSFIVVSDFLDPRPGNSRVTEPERVVRASSSCLVLSWGMSSLHETSIQTYRPLNQKLETLEQQLDEVSFLLAQSVLRKEKLLARALMQLQSISAAVHSKSATISIPNDPEVEPMTPSTKDMGVDPISLDTTTEGMADTLPIYHTADYGMLEGPLPSTLPIMGERVASTPNF